MRHDHHTPSEATTDATSSSGLPPATATAAPEPPRSWRRLFLRGRSAVAVGMVTGALVIGALGFGAGYAVADRNSHQDNTPQMQTPPFDRGDGQFGGPGGMGGPPGDQMGEQPEGGAGSSEQAPDGDGQPDETAPDSSAGSTQTSVQES